MNIWVVVHESKKTDELGICKTTSRVEMSHNTVDELRSSFSDFETFIE